VATVSAGSDGLAPSGGACGGAVDCAFMALAVEISRESLAAVANEIVRLKAQYYGKGPTEAKAYLNDETLVVALKGGLTTVERTLLEAGDDGLVRQVRLRFQEVMEQNFIDAVQRLTGQRVLTYMSQIVFDPDYCFEFFVLSGEKI
jgi:uncharacterized protein YbcI